MEDITRIEEQSNSNPNETSPLLSSPDINSVVEERGTKLKLYWYRWYMLAVLAVINLSNGILWLSFSNIAGAVSMYYQASTIQINWLSIVFMLCTLIFGLPAIYMLDKYGFRVTFYIAAWTNGLGAVIRILSTMSWVRNNNYAYPVLLSGQVISGCSQPFMMLASTKLAALWFGPNERTIANMVGSMANPIGVLLGGLLSTFVVADTRNEQVVEKTMPLLLEISAGPAILGMLMCLGVFKSLPPTPPSSSASEDVDEFCVGFKKLIRSPQYFMLALSYGAGVGLVSSLVTIIDLLLLPQGYTNQFSALCTSLIFGIGLFGATTSSILADRTKQHELLAKCGFGVGASFLISFVMLCHYPNLHIPLILMASILGFFCLSINPLCLELAVECSFPVAEGLSAGLLVLSGQIQATIFTVLLSINSRPITSHLRGTYAQDIINMYAELGFMGVTAVASVLFIVTFHCPYKRLRFEEKLEAERIIENARSRFYV